MRVPTLTATTAPTSASHDPHPRSQPLAFHGDRRVDPDDHDGRAPVDGPVRVATEHAHGPGHRHHQPGDGDRAVRVGRVAADLRRHGRPLGPGARDRAGCAAAGRGLAADHAGHQRMGPDLRAGRAQRRRRGRRQLLDPDRRHRATPAARAPRVRQRLHQRRRQLRSIRVRAAESGGDVGLRLDAGSVDDGSGRTGHRAAGLAAGWQGSCASGHSGRGRISECARAGATDVDAARAAALRRARPQLLVPARGLFHLRFSHRLPGHAPAG